uniref:CTCHY-type domain-containing protein n=2 Tax=Aegilops tauschii subsp. strangulata TaxID=200361 RepID=A0A453D9F2_AEGTS
WLTRQQLHTTTPPRLDFFHCMKCNCRLGMRLSEHKCREKGLETNCPICGDLLFTSSAAVRALPCGHFMHSACFQLYCMITLHEQYSSDS